MSMKKSSPTYGAQEIRNMALKLDAEPELYKILTGVINEELELYSEEDIPIIMQASMILFTKSLLKGANKFLIR